MDMNREGWGSAVKLLGTAIVATISVDPAAATGPRDVTVTGGDITVTYAGAFDIEAPLDVFATYGTVAQGSVFLADMAMLDTRTPFDTTVTGDGFSKYLPSTGATNSPPIQLSYRAWTSAGLPGWPGGA